MTDPSVDARTAAIEAMARRGVTDDEWDSETVAYVKTHRAIATDMLDALLAADHDGIPLVVALAQERGLRSYGKWTHNRFTDELLRDDEGDEIWTLA